MRGKATSSCRVISLFSHLYIFFHARRVLGRVFGRVFGRVVGRGERIVKDSVRFYSRTEYDKPLNVKLVISTLETEQRACLKPQFTISVTLLFTSNTHFQVRRTRF